MKNRFLVSLLFVLLLAVVVAGSFVSSKLWTPKVKKIEPVKSIVINDSMTIGQIGAVNHLNKKILKSVFGIKDEKGFKEKFVNVGIPKEVAINRIKVKMALIAENKTKNWTKIKIKFILWILVLLTMFFLLRSGRVRRNNRKLIYLGVVILFGVILGSEPGPMGTIKDSIVLFGEYKTLFLPRLISLLIMLLLVVLANKFICSWGCQFGTLQDLIFRLNEDNKGKPVFKRFKVPFAVSNSIRVIFFIIFTVIALNWAFDIISPINPFKIFSPALFGIVGIVFVAFILVLSLFVYRPWCHFFCPFGLIGWLFEKISIFKIKVNYDKCIACGLCEKSCPSNAMKAILRGKKIIPDCFSCGSCIESCPTKAITFSAGIRKSPPKGKFDKLDNR
jgi:polyferredoxin